MGIEEAFAGLGDLAYLISTAIFGTAEVAGQITQAAEFIQALLGPEGIQAVNDLRNLSGGTGVELEFTAIRNLEAFANVSNQEVENMMNLGISIWDEEGISVIAERVFQTTFTRSDFIRNVGTIGKQLIINGVDMGAGKGIELLKVIVTEILGTIKEGATVKNAVKLGLGVFAVEKIKDYLKDTGRHGSEAMKKGLAKVAGKVLPHRVFDPNRQEPTVAAGGFEGGQMSLE